jgi:hypothetical protein
MKNIILIVLVALVPILSIGQGLKYGMSLGVSLNKWHGDADKFAADLAYEMNHISSASGFSFSNKSRAGISIGIFADVPIQKSFSIQPELCYVQKGTKFKGQGQMLGYTVEETLIMQTDYLDLAVLAKLKLGQGQYKPYLIAGPGVGYLVRSKMKVKVSVAGESESDSEKMEDFKKMDAKICVGGGFRVLDTVGLEVRYQFGLVPVLEDESSDAYSLKNGGFVLNMVFNF